MDFLKLNKYNLGDYDFKILIDKSYSMENTDCPGGISRWKQAHNMSKALAHACAHYDKDGIDVITFSNKFSEFNNVKASTVDQIFRDEKPDGSTDTTQALHMAIKDIMSGTATKPLVVLVLTDGTPNSGSSLTRLIIEASKKIKTRKELGISFLQVGNDKSARSFLEGLDDDLTSKGAALDIVDTKNFDEVSAMGTEDVLIAALTD